MDSLSKIDLAIAAEDRFGVAIPDEDLERLVVVGDLLDYGSRLAEIILAGGATAAHSLKVGERVRLSMQNLGSVSIRVTE